MTNLLTVLPLAFVMIAGPQIITAVLLATSAKPRLNSLAFLCGVGAAVTLGVSVTYFVVGSVRSLAGASSHKGSSGQVIDIAVLALLVILVVIVFLRRKETHPPKWMTKLQAASPEFAVTIGFVLFLLMPTDLVAMITVGTALVRQGEPWWHSLVFVGVTVILAGLPLIILLILGKKADRALPKMRNWMTKNSWIVSEIVIVFFLGMTLKGLLAS